MDATVKQILSKIKSGQDITHAERAYLVRNNVNALAAFMIDNNPGSVNLALRQMGYTHLGFEPNKKALQRQLQIFLDGGNLVDFEEVVKKFNLKPDGLPVEYVNELIKLFPQS